MCAVYVSCVLLGLGVLMAVHVSVSKLSYCFLSDPKCSSSSSTGSSKEGKHHKEEVYLVPVKLSQEVGTAARR